MLRCRLCFVAAAATLAAAGCTMCPPAPDDYAYAAYGGLVQRADMFQGRVGSAFAPAEGVPGESVEVIHNHDSAYPSPVLMAPEEVAPPGAPAAASSYAEGNQSQAAAAAFDPGDILSSPQ